MKRSYLIKNDAIEIADEVLKLSDEILLDTEGEITINIMDEANDWKEKAISAGVYEIDDEYEFFNHLKDYATELLNKYGYEVTMDDDVLVGKCDFYEEKDPDFLYEKYAQKVANLSEHIWGFNKWLSKFDGISHNSMYEHYEFTILESQTLIELYREGLSMEGLSEEDMTLYEYAHESFGFDYFKDCVREYEYNEAFTNLKESYEPYEWE